jgi:hypothetical protein
MIHTVEKTISGPSRYFAPQEQRVDSTSPPRIEESKPSSEQNGLVLDSGGLGPAVVKPQSVVHQKCQQPYQPSFQPSLQPLIQPPIRIGLDATPIDSSQDPQGCLSSLGNLLESQDIKSALEGSTSCAEHTVPALDGTQASKEYIKQDFQNGESTELDLESNRTPSSQDNNSIKDKKESDMPSALQTSKNNKRRAPDPTSDGEVEVETTPQPKKIAMSDFQRATDSALQSTLNAGRALQQGVRSMISMASPSPKAAIQSSPAAAGNSISKSETEPSGQVTEDVLSKHPEVSTRSQDKSTLNSAEAPTPKPKLKPTTINSAAALPKSWQVPQVLTSKQSPLAKASGTIAKILDSDEAWHSLTAEQQLHLHDMLGNQDPEVSEDGKYPSPMPHLTSKMYKDTWQREVETVERDIKDGRMDPKWRAKADAAFEARLKGDLLDDAQKAARQRRRKKENGGGIDFDGQNEQDEDPILGEDTAMERTRSSKSPQCETDEEGDEEFAPNKRKPTAKRKLKPKVSPKPKQARTSKGRKEMQSLVEETSEGERDRQRGVPQRTTGRILKPKLSNDIDSTAYSSNTPVGIRRAGGEH